MYWFLVPVALVAFYCYAVWNNNYWKKRGVVYEKPTFLLGSFGGVISATEHFGVMFERIYNKFKDVPYVGVFKLRQPTILIRDLELVKNVMVKDFSSFANNDFEVDGSADPILVENIFVQTGEEWKRNRSSWTAALTMNKIKATHEIASKKCDQMIEHFKRQIENNPNKPIEARLLSSSFFMDIIVNSIFGLNVDAFAEKENRYSKIVNSFFQPNFWDGMKVLLFFLAPGLVSFLKLKFVPAYIQNELFKIADEILEKRKITDFQKNNAFDTIVTKDRSPTKYSVAGLVFNFLIDGIETSAGVSGFILYALAANPDVQKKLRDELNKAAEANNGEIPYEEIHKLPYLDMVYSETLRRFPPGLSIQRLCTKPYELPPTYPGAKPVTIEIGTPTVIPVYALHMNPEYFPDPERFDPERFNDENRGNIPKFAYLPFGEGPRACVGQRFGTNQIKIAVTGLVRNFEIRLAPGTRDKPLEIDPNVLIYRNKGGLWITLHNINK